MALAYLAKGLGGPVTQVYARFVVLHNYIKCFKFIFHLSNKLLVIVAPSLTTSLMKSI